jgi:cysteinyl-tRNA synthetase
MPVLALVPALLFSGLSSRNVLAVVDRPALLKSAQTWMYQIQELDVEGAVAALAATNYPLLVIEPGHNFNEWSYDTAAIINALRTIPGGGHRLILAYVDIGQAEDYRDYWGANWIPPGQPGGPFPSFLVSADPDGWSGNYPVAYWDPAWQALWLGPTGIVTELANFGFDGIYMDWVEAYDDDDVIARATTDGKDPAAEMMAFIENLGAAGKAVIGDFLVVPQNAPYLLDADSSRYAAAIDGVAFEDTWFHGEGDAGWDDPGAGDLRDRHSEPGWTTEDRLTQFQSYLDLGLSVFTCDYCISRSNACLVYREALKKGLRPLVTRVSLSRLTVTPPEMSCGGNPSMPILLLEDDRAMPPTQ